MLKSLYRVPMKFKYNFVDPSAIIFIYEGYNVIFEYAETNNFNFK